jgi:hypothetical protein
MNHETMYPEEVRTAHQARTLHAESATYGPCALCGQHATARRVIALNKAGTASASLCAQCNQLDDDHVLLKLGVRPAGQ